MGEKVCQVSLIYAKQTVQQ